MTNDSIIFDGQQCGQISGGNVIAWTNFDILIDVAIFATTPVFITTFLPVSVGWKATYE